ncbi:uncharacterized protein LOC134221084 [Armigeres subalbatus]|uniref:uncharacterized protein LOC134221084 n=1 Tax=Armigeres subalbatus TaxID=124917 RepID=UPI002ED31885
MYMWDHYIAFLRHLMSQEVRTPMRCIFQSVFYDEALVNYNYNGITNTPGVKKRAMKGYAIFRDCFLVAWQEFGVTDDMIRATLTEIIKNINRRKRNRHYQNRIQKMRKLKNSKGIKREIPTSSLLFPLVDPQSVAQLEKSIQSDPNIRRKYIKFLRRIKTSRQSLDDMFGKICTDDAIFRHYTWGLPKNSPHYPAKRESLQFHSMFTDCMLDAWESHGITMNYLKSKMANIIKRIYVRNNVRNFRAKQYFHNNGHSFLGLE